MDYNGQLIMATKRNYRPRDSYISKDAVKRQRQLDNLLSSKKGRPLGYIPKAVRAERMTKMDVITFAEEHFCISETRKPIVLLDFEKKILRDLFEAEVKPTLALLGFPKKSGKSTLSAIIALWFLITTKILPPATFYLPYGGNHDFHPPSQRKCGLNDRLFKSFQVFH